MLCTAPTEDIADELVRSLFESTLEDFKFNWGGAKDMVMMGNTPGEIFCFALFYRIQEYWKIIKDKTQTSKPLKVLSAQQLTALFDRTEKYLDDLLEVRFVVSWAG